MSASGASARRAFAAAGAGAIVLLAGWGSGTAWADESTLRARRHYTHHCVGCHLVDGRGAPAKGVPTLRDQLALFLQVPGGRDFIVQVPGVMHTPLKDAEIAELMNWLLREVSAPTLPAGTAPYTEAEIRRLRATRPADIPGTRARLVRELRERGVAIE